ncbi:MAG: Trk family potassium uptake protein [Kiritimatiellae bacterium]|nr:Trk family potassium uptake protein [Kiritimatiellia bacterium]
MKSRWLIVFGFLGAILLGAFLFMLPISSQSHTWMRPLDALFTSCSAVCITGLTVIDVGRDLSLFGQTVLLCLVQLGCLGIMTCATFFLVVVGRRISLASEFSLMNAYGVSGVRGFRSLVVWVVAAMLTIEAAGALLLWLQFTSDQPFLQALANGRMWYRAWFFAVMSFCNAGFSLDPGSISGFQNQPFVLVTLGVLVILGGLGFLVLYNLCTVKFWRRNLLTRGRLTLHARVVLQWSLFFSLVMFVLFYLLEWDKSLSDYGAASRPAVAFFQALTPRTCGFTVVPVEELQPATRFLSEVMMFIGAAPGGAGGGIKITTFAVFLTTLLAICRGHRDTVMLKRAVPEAVVREATVIVIVFAALVTCAMTVLLISEEGRSFEYLLFETVSAVTTTGLTCGDTTVSLSTVGRVVIMLCMFCGRLGAIAIVMLIGGRDEKATIRYAKEELVVG